MKSKTVNGKKKKNDYGGKPETTQSMFWSARDGRIYILIVTLEKMSFKLSSATVQSI